jgi:protein-disulfide isomerase
MPPKPRAPKPKSKQAPGSGGLGSRRNLLLAGVGAVAVAAILIVASLVLAGGDDSSSGTTPTATSDLAGIPQSGTQLGDPDTNVILIEYADPQCPFCKRYSEEGFPGLVEEYVAPGKIRMEFRGLAFIGEDSAKALRFIYAAGLQDKLWQFTEAVYANQGGENEGWVTDDLMRDIGESIEGLDVDRLFVDAEGDEVKAQIAEAQQRASEAGVGGTPWFYIQIGDDEPYEIQPSSLSPEAFRDALDDALAG